MQSPSFSIVVPAFNGEKFLQDALDSISAQTLKTWECIIVDDNSSDNSCDIASKWANAHKGQARVLKCPKRKPGGVAAARNLGIRESSSSWMAFLDQDDIWKPSKLELQASFIRENPDFLAVGCLPEIRFEGIEKSPFIDNWEAMIYSIDQDRSANMSLRDFVAGCPYCMSGVVAKKSSLLEMGGFDNALTRISDWKMWACLASRGPLAMLRSVLVTYRIHGDNELLKLQSEPLGMVKALLTLRSHLIDWIMRDQEFPREQATELIDGLIKDEGLSWLRQTSQTN